MSRPLPSLLAAVLACALSGPQLAIADEIEIGSQAPDFDLQGTDGTKHKLADFLGAAGDQPAAVVVVFTCNTCPFSIAYEPVLLDLDAKYAKSNVRFVLINSNDPEIKPGDSFEAMQALAKEKKYTFPYLFDATQSVAKAYGARVTPHVFVLDAKQVVRYRGRINDDRDPAKTSVHDLVNALDALVAGKEIETTSTKAFGCSIKWKKDS